MPVKDRLQLLSRLGDFASVSALAREASVSEGAMRQHVRRDSVPYSKAKAYVMASATNTTPEWLMTGRGAPPTQKLPPDMRPSNKVVLLGTHSGGKVPRQTPIEHAMITGDVEGGVSKDRAPAADFPVFGTTELGGSVVELSVKPSFLADRPAWSKSVHDFSYFVAGDHMGPHPGRGDRIEVNTVIPPVPGNLVVLISGERETGWKAMLRELVAITDKQWKVKQYRPAKEETFDRAEWHTAYKVGGIIKA